MVSLFGRGFESHQLHTTSLSKGKTQIPLGHKRSLRPSLPNETRNEQTPLPSWKGVCLFMKIIENTSHTKQAKYMSLTFNKH